MLRGLWVVVAFDWMVVELGIGTLGVVLGLVVVILRVGIVAFGLLDLLVGL